MTKMNKILSAIQALAALIAVGAVKIWAPVCGKLLELTNGKQVPMKCHWAGQATIALAVILLLLAVMSLTAKKDFKKFQIVALVGGVMLFLVYGSLIGVCASETMPCQVTALWGRGAAIATIVTALINLLSGKEGQIPD